MCKWEGYENNEGDPSSPSMLSVAHFEQQLVVVSKENLLEHFEEEERRKADFGLAEDPSAVFRQAQNPHRIRLAFPAFPSHRRSLADAGFITAASANDAPYFDKDPSASAGDSPDAAESDFAAAYFEPNSVAAYASSSFLVDAFSSIGASSINATTSSSSSSSSRSQQGPEEIAAPRDLRRGNGRRSPTPSPA